MASKLGTAKMNHQNLSEVLLATGIYILIAFAATAVVAMLIHHELLQEDNLYFYAMAIMFVASAAGTWVNRDRNLFMSLLEGSAYMAFTLLMTILLFGAQFQGILEGTLAILLGCLFSFLTGRKQGRRRKKHRSKI